MATKNRTRHAASLTAEEIAQLGQEERQNRADRVLAEINALLERERCRIQPHLIFTEGALQECGYAVIAD